MVTTILNYLILPHAFVLNNTGQLNLDHAHIYGSGATHKCNTQTKDGY